MAIHTKEGLKVRRIVSGISEMGLVSVEVKLGVTLVHPRYLVEDLIADGGRDEIDAEINRDLLKSQ